MYRLDRIQVFCIPVKKQNLDKTISLIKKLCQAAEIEKHEIYVIQKPNKNHYYIILDKILI